MNVRPVSFLLPLFVLLAFSACGPILGMVSRTSEGTSVRDAGGNPADIRAGAKLLILSPFPKTKEGFYLVRGEDEQKFADEFNRLGLFVAEARSVGANGSPEANRAIASKSPASLKSEFGLAADPDVLLTGTLLARKTYVAPMRGVVMAVSWRLVFTDLRGGRSWTVDAESKELAEDTIPRIVERIGNRLGR